MTEQVIPVWDGHGHYDWSGPIAVKLDDWREFRRRFGVVVVRMNMVEDGHWDVECVQDWEVAARERRNTKKC